MPTDSRTFDCVIGLDRLVQETVMCHRRCRSTLRQACADLACDRRCVQTLRQETCADLACDRRHVQTLQQEVQIDLATGVCRPCMRQEVCADFATGDMCRP